MAVISAAGDFNIEQTAAAAAERQLIPSVYCARRSVASPGLKGTPVSLRILLRFPLKTRSKCAGLRPFLLENSAISLEQRVMGAEHMACDERQRRCEA
jgi:hypothetical protein